MSSRTLLRIVVLVFVCALALRFRTVFSDPAAQAINREQGVYQRLRSFIHDHYVGEVDEKQLFYGALQGMTQTLDRHSLFLPPEQYKQLESMNKGEFSGVGIEIAQDPAKGIVVITPLAGNPAYRAGILPGDLILKVDGKSTEGMNLEEVSQLVRGTLGSKVTLTVLHEGSTEPEDIAILRDTIKIDSVLEAQILKAPVSVAARIPQDTPKIGYIQVAGFQDNTVADLVAALEKLEADGMEALVLDLRGNPGGLLTAAVKICDLFVDQGTIVTVRGRIARDLPLGEQVLSASSNGKARAYPIAVLINKSSASASEIVAGCLKDLNRAVLVGEKSFGKGSVQTIYAVELEDNTQGALKLTTAKYFTPSGVSIDGIGIEPNYDVPLKPEQVMQLYEKRRARHVIDNTPEGARKENSKTKAPEGDAAEPKAPAPPAGEGENPKGEKDGGAKGEQKPAEEFYDSQIEKAVQVLTEQLQKK
ncbi:MAG: S41 family peptidase [Planctomycetes bacterium]|nr:S41 family peptidase [Planctomycetota bacterium]